MQAVVTVTQPIEEPVSVELAKLHCRVDGSDEDTLFQDILIPAARRWCEKKTGRTFCTTTKRLTIDNFPGSYGPIELPHPPLVSVTSVAYTNTAGSAATVSSADYRVITDATPGFIEPAYGDSWPCSSVQDISGAVQITYRAGFGNAEDVPSSIKQAMLMLIAHWYTHREAIGTTTSEIQMAVETLLASEWTGVYV